MRIGCGRTGGRAGRRTLGLLAAACIVAAAGVAAQDVPATQRLFEAGQYQQAVDAAGPDAAPPVVFIAALSAQKLGASDRAGQLFRRLAERPAEDAWHHIGRAASLLLEENDQAADDAAQQAVAAAGDLPEAHYQLGLVLAKRRDWSAAAAAFDRASVLNPSLAYAYYYGGLMHYRANRPDLMSVRFERFLKLAPEAPERPEVLQIMRTIRGH